MKVLYIQYTNPAAYPPLEHSSRILADAGWQVMFLGTGALGADSLRFPPYNRIKVLRMPFCPAGWRQKLHYLSFQFWILWTALRWKPDCIYASDLFSCPVALNLKRLRFRVLYHEHDSPSEGLQINEETGSRTSWFQRFLLGTRKKLAQLVNLCVLPNEQRCELFKQATKTSRPVICVWNCPAKEEAVPEPQKEADKFIVFYHGSIVPGRLPLTVLHALKQLPQKVILRVAGYETSGHRDYAGTLRAEAEKLGLADRIEFLGEIPQRAALFKECRKAHVGLTLMPLKSKDVNVRAMVGASNKPFDYLACGLALLVSDLPDWRAMYVESGYGLACNPEDPESIASAIRWFLNYPYEMRAMGERGRQRILEEWNYEKQFMPVLERINRRDTKHV